MTTYQTGLLKEYRGGQWVVKDLKSKTSTWTLGKLKIAQVTPTYPTSGLVSLWTLDNSLNDYYGTHNLTLVAGNQPSYTESGKVNQACAIASSFVGASTDSGVLDVMTGTHDYSFSMWVKTGGGWGWYVKTEPGIFAICNTDYGWFSPVVDGAIGMYYWPNYSTDCKFTSSAKNDGEWHHMVVGYKNGTGIFLYFDNNYEGATAYTAYQTPTQLTIGYNTNTGLSMFIDQVYLYDRALDSTDVAQLWNNGNGI